MNKLLVIGILGLLLFGTVSGYYCFQEEDNESIKDFKSKINRLTIGYELSEGVTEDAIVLKHKYFGGCN